MRRALRAFLDLLYAVSYHLSFLRSGEVAIDDYVTRHLYGGPRYQEPKRLGIHEFQMFSQSGADGIIAEIFRRIGTTNKFFAEFGVGNGLENNTVALLLGGWSGVWIEASKRNYKEIGKNLSIFIDDGKLVVLPEFVDRDNIVSLFERSGVPRDLDFLSIDIDGNDYWVWEALLERYSPRVVMIEYNSLLGPSLSWSIAYNPERRRERLIVSSYYGASLKALERLGARHGQRLVGCDFLGLNAFFVREDLVADRFCEPYTAENHFEPNRQFLYRRNGQPRRIGRFVSPD